MSKKKPYSKIENAKALRKEQFSFDAMMRKTAKNKSHIPTWAADLLFDAHNLTEKSIRLRDFLWVKETEDSPALYTKEAEALGRKYCQLLVRQHKAMEAYKKILDVRVSLLDLKKPTNADHRKQRGRTAPNKAEAK